MFDKNWILLLTVLLFKKVSQEINLQTSHQLYRQEAEWIQIFIQFLIIDRQVNRMIYYNLLYIIYFKLFICS